MANLNFFSFQLEIFFYFSDNNPNDMKWNLADGFVIVYTSLLLLGSDIRTDTLSKRISYLSVLVCGMLFFWLWEADLISYFSFPSKRLPFNNLEEFLTYSDTKVSQNFQQLNQYKSKYCLTLIIQYDLSY